MKAIVFGSRTGFMLTVLAIGLVIYPTEVNCQEKTTLDEMRSAPSGSAGVGRSWAEPSFSRQEEVWLQESDDHKNPFTINWETLARYTYWNWFEGPSGDNEYNYGFQRTRLSFGYTSDYLTAFLQPQYVHMFNVPDDAFKPPPEGPLGMGGLYYIHSHDREPHDFGIHQAYAALHTPDSVWQLKFGRFEYSDGLEVLEKADGKHFNQLKKMRLGDRLISPFGWSAFGRSFDGILAQHDGEKVNLSGSFFYPTQGGWEEDIDATIDDIRIATFTVTAKRGSILPGTELAGFYYNYRDNRDVAQRVDNTDLGCSAVDMDIDVFGGHVLGIYDIGPGKMDILLWGAVQTGDWYELDHEAYAFSAEAGYQFSKAFAKPWVRVGYFVGSGDSDPTDRDHETFFQMAPGTRLYNLLPYCDLRNTEDMFVQLITHPLDKLMLRVDYHVVHLDDDADRWYMGSGPTQREGGICGYLGRPSSGEEDLAQEFHVILQYDVNEHWGLSGSYSHIWGGDVVRGVYGEDDEADYLAAEVTLRF